MSHDLRKIGHENTSEDDTFKNPSTATFDAHIGQATAVTPSKQVIRNQIIRPKEKVFSVPVPSGEH